MLATCGLRRTGLPPAKAEPSGKNATKAMPRASHSSSTGRECRSARFIGFCTHAMSVIASA